MPYHCIITIPYQYHTIPDHTILHYTVHHTIYTWMITIPGIPYHTMTHHTTPLPVHNINRPLPLMTELSWTLSTSIDAAFSS